MHPLSACGGGFRSQTDESSLLLRLGQDFSTEPTTALVTRNGIPLPGPMGRDRVP